MKLLRVAWFRLRAPFHRAALDRDFAEEIRAHLQSHIDDNVRAGLAPDEARRHALLALGGVDQTRERYGDRRGVPWIDTLAQDCRYALRTFLRRPGFAIVVIVTLMLAIGANTLTFGVVNAVAFRPLPIDHPEHVVFVQPNTDTDITHSFPNYRDLRDRNVTFDGLFGYRMSPMDVEVNGEPRRAWGYLATGNYFDVLGVQPAAGRFFHQSDDQKPGGAPFAVLSYEFWTAQFRADRSIVGTSIRINRLPYTIIGVAPAGFTGTEALFRPRLWVPMMMQGQIEVGNPWLESRSTFNVMVAGRLKVGVSRAQATSNLNVIAESLARDYPESNHGLSFRLVKPGLLGDSLRSPAQAFSVGILALAALVLLIACANLASTMAARGADRAREIAIRLSLGASRGRIIRQLLTEALLLSLVAAAAGYAVAYIASAALSSWQFPIEVPTRFDVRPDMVVFVFTFSVSIVAGLVFGLAPARQTSSVDANATLKNVDTAGGSRRRWPIRDILVAVQVALCFVLVAACLLSLRGLQQAIRMPVGFEPRGVSMVGFQLGLSGYDRSRGMAFQRTALEAVRRLPGVTSAAFSNGVPLNINQSSSDVFPDMANEPAARGQAAVPYAVSPGFFETLEIVVRRGRPIEASDTVGAPRVAVVNETFARQIFRTPDAVGRRFRFGPKGAPIEVVGIVGTGKYRSLTEDPQPAVFTSILQRYDSETMLLVRASVPEDQMLAEMRRTLAQLDPGLPLHSAESLDHMLDLPRLPNVAAATALSAFGLIAVLLAATGIHGVVAYAVARRRREIGIRVAVGATSLDVLRLVVGRMAALICTGAIIGLGLAIVIGPLLTHIVYQVSPREPIVFISVAVLVTLVGITACWVPALRSLQIEPLAALRTE